MLGTPLGRNCAGPTPQAAPEKSEQNPIPWATRAKAHLSDAPKTPPDKGYSVSCSAQGEPPPPAKMVQNRNNTPVPSTSLPLSFLQGSMGAEELLPSRS